MKKNKRTEKVLKTKIVKREKISENENKYIFIGGHIMVAVLLSFRGRWDDESGRIFHSYAWKIYKPTKHILILFSKCFWG